MFSSIRQPLTIALSLFLLDDAAWARLLPDRLLGALGAGGAPPAHAPFAQSVVAAAAAAFLLAVGALQVLGSVQPGQRLWRRLERRLNVLAPLCAVNSYGLFRVMTLTRPEIVVEGSLDGKTWQAYEFRYKPGDVRRRPAFVEPHRPRLDWQMWFAALRTFESEPWFRSFLYRLLENRPEVTRLLARNPFPNGPRYIRAQFYDYRFATPAERRASGAWWSRTFLGPYSPTYRKREATTPQ